MGWKGYGRDQAEHGLGESSDWYLMHGYTLRSGGIPMQTVAKKGQEATKSRFCLPSPALPLLQNWGVPLVAS